MNSTLMSVMYHYVRDNSKFAYTVYARAPEEFERQLIYLKENYDIISLSELYLMCQSNTIPNNHKFAILTFDDSYSDHYYVVHPLLKSARLKDVFLRQ